MMLTMTWAMYMSARSKFKDKTNINNSNLNNIRSNLSLALVFVVSRRHPIGRRSSYEYCQPITNTLRVSSTNHKYATSVVNQSQIHYEYCQPIIMRHSGNGYRHLIG